MRYQRLTLFFVISVGLTSMSLLFGAADFGVVQCAGIAFVSTVTLLIWALRGTPPKRPVLWLSLMTYVALSVLLVTHYSVARDQFRWGILSGAYKPRVAMRPKPSNNELKHVEWDGWGFAGMDTSVFLAFDPTDSLSGVVTASRSSTKEHGLPCPVYRVHRLERRWYAVTFYTDTYWGQGNCR
jgi:hypothetical protein